jgi:NAD(P)H-dependent FMN reductase
MGKLVAVVGSAVHSGRTRIAVDIAVAAAVAHDGDVDADVIDLAQQRVSILDGRALDDYADDTVDVINRVGEADMFILASPVYRGTYTGAFKNLLDHVPLEALEGKVVGLIATGATLHHYLAIDLQFRALLAWFNAHVLPGFVYLDGSAYSDGKVSDPTRLSSLKELGETLVIVSERLRGVPARPPCLTREVVEARGP